jgi:hypothetical protein
MEDRIYRYCLTLSPTVSGYTEKESFNKYFIIEDHHGNLTVAKKKNPLFPRELLHTRYGIVEIKGALALTSVVWCYEHQRDVARDTARKALLTEAKRIFDRAEKHYSELKGFYKGEVKSATK